MKTLAIAIAAALISLSAVASGTGPAVTVTPATQRPEAPLTVSGTSFGVSEAIDVYVDTVDTLLLATDVTGAFSGSVTVPASAQPGAHFITAIGRHSGDAAQKQITVSTPWLQFGYTGRHDGWNPYENTLDTSSVADLETLWDVPLFKGGNGSTPVVQAGRIFVVSNGGGIYALSTTTGKVVWSILNSAFTGSPAIAGGLVYLGGTDGNLYALSAANGSTKWTFLTGGSVGSPDVVNGVVYVADSTGDLYALNAATGAKIWSALPNGATALSTIPSLSGGVLYVGSTNGNLFAIDPATGNTNWTFTAGGAIKSTAAVSGGLVFFGCDDGNLYVLNKFGTLFWSHGGDAAIEGPPAVSEGKVFFIDENGLLSAFNVGTAAMVWHISLVPTMTNYHGGPIVANGVIYVAGGSTLYAFNAINGTLLRTLTTGESDFGTPAVSDGVAYVNALNGSAVAMSLLANSDAIRANTRPPEISTLRPDFSLMPTETGRAHVTPTDAED